MIRNEPIRRQLLGSMRLSNYNYSISRGYCTSQIASKTACFCSHSITLSTPVLSEFRNTSAFYLNTKDKVLTDAIIILHLSLVYGIHQGSFEQYS